MANYLNYIAYFRTLAEDYLAHSELNKTFYRKGMDEFLSGLTTDGNYPAMLIENYDFRYSDNTADSILKPMTVGMTIFSHVGDTGDFQSIVIAMDTCEALVDKIYNRIRYDRKMQHCPNFLRHTDINSFEVVPVQNSADGNYGWFVTFIISSVHNTKLV